MLDWLCSQGFAVHLSRGLVLLEKEGVLMDFPTLEEAVAAVRRRAA